MNNNDLITAILNQAPDFYNQTIAYGIITSWIGLAFCLLGMIVGVIVFWFALRSKIDEFQLIGGVVSVGVVLISALIFSMCVSTICEATYFPKAYFLSQIGHHE